MLGLAMKTSPVTEQWSPVAALPRGEYFKLSDKQSAKVWKLGEYDRSARSYWAEDCDDISNGKLVKGSRAVFVGFTY
jgi:hypothetical protein